MLPAGLTNRVFLLPTASVTHFLVGELLCFSPPPPCFNIGGLGTCPAQEELAKLSDLQTCTHPCSQLPSAGEQPRTNKKLSNKKGWKQGQGSMEEAVAVAVSPALVVSYNTELGTERSFRVGPLFPGTPCSRVVPGCPMSIPPQLGLKTTEAGTNTAARNLAVLVLCLFSVD